MPTLHRIEYQTIANLIKSVLRFSQIFSVQWASSPGENGHIAQWVDLISIGFDYYV